jgi:hypothetical protein
MNGTTASDSIASSGSRRRAMTNIPTRVRMLWASAGIATTIWPSAVVWVLMFWAKYPARWVSW